jgi:hypothetical protein
MQIPTPQTQEVMKAMNLRTRMNNVLAGYRQAFFAASVQAYATASELLSPAESRSQRAKRLVALSPVIGSALLSAVAIGLADCTSATTNGSQIVDLANNVAWFLIAVGLAVSLGSFAYAGLLFATAVGNSDRAGKGMKLAKNVLIGMGILVSGAVVKAILITVVTSTGNSVVGGKGGAVDATNNAVACSGTIDSKFNGK